MSGRAVFLAVLLCVLVVGLFVGHLVVGAVPLSWPSVREGLLLRDQQAAEIVRGVRLPEAMTALAAGMGLAACGLLMQTLFRNPLAGPSILGLTSGSSLAVALLMFLPLGGLGTWLSPDLLLVLGAFCGSFLVLLLILGADRRMGDGVALLIVGLMVGYLCGALIDVLNVIGSGHAVKRFVLWGMGSFGTVVMERLPWLLGPVILALSCAILLVKPLNGLLLGETYAMSVGIPVRPIRSLVICTTGILAGVITAFCGPIAFLGLVTPHIARALCRTSDHRILMPITILCGAVLALGCGLLAKAPFVGGALPLNAITSLLGAPVVAWVLISGKRWTRPA